MRIESIRCWLNSHKNALLVSHRNLLRSPLATFFTVMVIAVALALPTIFCVFKANIQQLTHTWQQGEHIALYLPVGLSQVDAEDVFERVQQTQGVDYARFISPEAGLLELKKQAGLQDVSAYLPNNPLPAVIEVVPSANIDTTESMQALFDVLSHYPHVEQAKLDLEWVNRLYALLKLVTNLMQSFMVLLGLAVMLIIGNTLRLAIQNRQEEVQLLKLMGATDGFIARPFIYTGLCYGALGAFFALFLTWILFQGVMKTCADALTVFDIVDVHGLSIFMGFNVFLVSLGLGWLGSFLSVKRQLALIEP